MKNGVEEIKGSFTISISQVRGQEVVPIELKIDLSDPIFNPDVNAEGTKDGTTGLTTLEDVTRVVNNAIQRAIAGTESPNTFSYGEGTMSLADARLKLAQANVSAATVTENNGQSTIILRGAFDSQFELRMDESLEMSLKAGRDIGELEITNQAALKGTSVTDTTVKVAGAAVNFAEDFAITEYLIAAGAADIIGGTTPLSVAASTVSSVSELQAALNAQSAARGLGLVFAFNNAGTELTITDTQGRGVDDGVTPTVTVTNGGVGGGGFDDPAPAVTLEGDYESSIKTQALNPPVNMTATFTAGDLGTLKFDLAGQTFEVSLYTADSVADIDTAINNALTAAGAPWAITDLVAANDSGNLKLEAALGHSITNVSLTVPSRVDITGLTATFNDGDGENISNFSITIGGERIDLDLTDPAVTQLANQPINQPAGLGQAIQTALATYNPNNLTPPPFADVEVLVDTTTGAIEIIDPQGRNIDVARLSGPETIKLFDHEQYDNALNDPAVNNPYASEQVNLTQINVTTRFDSMIALNIIDGALNQISDLRSELGAVQKLFESAVDNLGTYNVNLSAARSRILDTDFAAETAQLTRAQILQQAGISTLSQANAGPQSVLSLLQ